ncbi:hypothetical protein PoB_001902500 [Plakobranchus ocellatus]|uniref:Uncharacterized protein n=1 Tax=Plakobranchus ocellatus TaxID=259542 RepID=A0AAV3ZBJ6_9GAST|nr:hypothetical protein PoB_001902500 [Plakobranchus ocellatus]
MVHFPRSTQKVGGQFPKTVAQKHPRASDECQKVTTRRGAPVKIFQNWTLRMPRGQACDDHCPVVAGGERIFADSNPKPYKRERSLLVIRAGSLATASLMPSGLGMLGWKCREVKINWSSVFVILLVSSDIMVRKQLR